ncbi:hypothetical protein KXW25_004149 [Aspergillus fumigatus]|nr:hypothetical protein KXW25_004149 [Aspergillus fumigatus]
MVSLSKALIGLRMASFYAAEPPERVKKAQGLHLTTSLTPNGRKVHILLEELKDTYGLEWMISLIDLDKNEQKKDWFLRLNPNAAVDRCKRELLQVYDVLEIRLSGRYGGGTREYLAGQGQGKYSIADINAWAWVRNIRRIGFSENELAPLPHLQQWVDRIAARPAVERGLGEWYDEDVHPELLLETA